MMQHSVQTYLCLLWGISVLFIPGTRSSSNSTTEPTTQLNPSDVLSYKTETQNATHKPAEMNVPTTTRAAASPTVESQAAHVSSNSNSNSSGVSAVDLVAVNTTAATGNSSGPRLHHATTTAAETQASHISVTTATAKPTEDPQPSTTSSETTAPATTFAGPAASSAATVATAAAPSSLQPTSIAEPAATSIAEPAATSSNTPSQNLTQTPHLAQNTSSPPVTMTTETTNVTPEAPPVTDPTLSATVTTNATSTTELSATSQLVSETQTHTFAPQLPHTTSSASTTESPNASASTNSTLSTTAFPSSAIGILIPGDPKRLPVSTTKPLKSTPASPPGASKSPVATEVQPCSTRGVVKQCLIVIASLAVLATIFIISTIILCTKLSARKYKVKKRQQGTEMMCISSLLPERNYSYTRQRNPVSNGVLVMHTGGDSDEDGGDNLTLSSFLPDNDRVV